MKKLLAIALISSTVASAWAAVTYNQTITAIYGSGNPNTGWTADTSGDIQLALRAKNRTNGSTTNVNGTYSFATAPAPRGLWNYEFSINSDINGTDPLTTYDYYLAADQDPSECINYSTSVVNPLTHWSDNSYGNNTTASGQGVEGAAAALASSNNIAQNSQNITFGDYPGGPQVLQPNATYNYELFAVAKGTGAGGTRLASVGITVVVGLGGAPCTDTDSDFDGVPDVDDDCIPSVLGGQVDVGSGPTSIANNGVNDHGCSIQDLVNECREHASNHGEYVSCIAELSNDLRKSGAITNKQSAEMKSGAAKSDIGK